MYRFLLSIGLGCLGCSSATDTVPNGGDSGIDAPSDATSDVQSDAHFDTQSDMGPWPEADGTTDSPADTALPDALGDANADSEPPPDADPYADGVPMDQVDVVGMGAGSPQVTQWAKTAVLRGMNIHRGSYYGPESWYFQIDGEGHKEWPSYKPFGGENDTPVCGNIWILVRQPGSTRWWAAPIEGLVDFTDIHPAGNLNFDHTNILADSPLAHPWQPMAGEVYGWMLTTNVFFPGSNGQERSNVLLEAWP